jgi:hypothetical protein
MVLSRNQKLAVTALVLAIGLIYYASHPLLLCRQLFIRDDETLYARLHLGDDLPYAWLTESNYSFRFADALLDGKLGLSDQPPDWVNETIPLRGEYYSVFPLGSVLTMLPFALAHRLIPFSAGALAIALIGGSAAFLFFRIAIAFTETFRDAVFLTLFATLGTWLWTNTAMGGAWQLALGFALIGELAALYFTIENVRPLLAGVFFAFAFGNRTEVIVTAPVFIYLLLRDSPPDLASRTVRFAKFCAFPFFLGIATLIYNAARFGSPCDFGLARLPGVLEEPWYRHGIFSVYAIPANAWQMLIEPWHRIAHSPYFLPSGFGGSIFLNAPFLICIFQTGARHRHLKLAAWIAIPLLTMVFWCHGNTGGWQFSYRGAIVMLPWFFLLLLEAARLRLRKRQLALIAFSILINSYATYFFLWTNWIQP